MAGSFCRRARQAAPALMIFLDTNIFVYALLLNEPLKKTARLEAGRGGIGQPPVLHQMPGGE